MQYFDEGGANEDQSDQGDAPPDQSTFSVPSWMSGLGSSLKSALGPTPGQNPLFSLAAKYLPLAVLISQLTTKSSNQRPGLPSQFTQPGAVSGPFNRSVAPFSGNPNSYYTYGQTSPPSNFFGGSQGLPGYSIPGQSGPGSFSPGAGAIGIATGGSTAGAIAGPGSGRDDKIDAKLSDGEYVMDAETVAMLGDGSLEEGARRLDQLRENVRRHKGKTLAKGKFSPNAKPPENYMGSSEE